MLRLLRKPRIIVIYLTVAAIFIALSFGWLLVTDGYALSRSLFGRGNGAYMDYYSHICFSHYLQDAYRISPHACFPPLAKTFYYLIGRVGGMGFPPLNREYFSVNAMNPVTQMYLLVGLILLSCVLFALVQEWLRAFSKKEQVLVSLCILLSNVWCIGVLERANIAGALAVLLPAAFLLKDSKKPWQRELGLVLIAIAAGIKIYPAVFGLLYIKERRWKEAARLLLYGVLLFAVPFILFGGMDGALQWISNTMEIQRNLATTYSFGGRLCTLLQTVGIYSTKPIGTPDGLASAATILFGAGSVVLVLFGPKHQTNWIDATLLCGICLLCPGWVGVYTVCIMVLPLLMFLRETRKSAWKWENVVACLSFAVIFATNLLLYYDGAVNITFYGVLALALLACGIRIAEMRTDGHARRMDRLTVAIER